MNHPQHRDMEFIRRILIEISEGRTHYETLSDREAQFLGVDVEHPLTGAEAQKLKLHLDLLEDADFVRFEKLLSGTYIVKSITWTGHDFLDSVRDGKIWRKTKDALSTVTTSSIDVIKAIAIGIAKKELSERVGIDFG